MTTARTRIDQAEHGTFPQCQHMTHDERTHHDMLPLPAIFEANTETDEADACELGSMAALEQIRRNREAERR